MKFLLENVRMRTEFENVISEQLGLFPVMINSALVSAQNRVRLYWTNIRTRTEVNLFDSVVYTCIPQPKDKGIYLKDILENDVDEKYYFSQAQIQKLLEKRYESDELDDVENIESEYYSLFGFDDFEDCQVVNNIEYTDLCMAFRGRFNSVTGRNEQQPEFRFDGKSNSLTTVQKDNLLLRRKPKECSPHIISGSIVSSKFGGGFRPIKSGKSACLMARARNDGNGQCVCMILKDDNISIRRLTPTECCRLQTIPDWYKWNCGDTQIYRMLGNGWTVDVIRHIFQFLNA